MVSEQDKAPTSHDVLSSEQQALFNEFANFLYAQYEESRLDTQQHSGEDGGDETFLHSDKERP